MPRFKVISRYWTGKNFLAFILIGILSCIVYANSLNNSFHFDDQHYVVENPYIRRIQNIPAFFQSPRYLSSEKSFTAHYRPLVVFSYTVNYAMGGLEPFGYHLLSLGFHIGSAFLIFLILQAMLTLPLTPSHQGRGEKEDPPVSLIPLSVALIFAVHPFNSEVVNYITARSSVMCAFFYLLAFYFWVRFRNPFKSLSPFPPHPHPRNKFGAGSIPPQTPNHGGRELKGGGRVREGVGFYIASLISFLLAVLSKEIAITFPAMLMLYDLFFVPLRKKGDYLKRLLAYIPFILSIVVPYLVLRKMFYGHFISSKFTRDFYLNLYTQTKVIVEYISLFLFPMGLTIDHSVRPVRSFYEMDVLFSSVILLGILLFAFYLWRYEGKYGGIWRIVSFSIIWFFVTLLPVTVIPLNAIMQENRAYLAGVGLAVITGIGAGNLSQKLAKTIMGLRLTKEHENPPTLNPLPQGEGRQIPPPIKGGGEGEGEKGEGESNNAAYSFTWIYLLIPLIIAYSTVTIQRNSVWSDDVTLWSDAVKKAPLSARSYDNIGLAYARVGNRKKAEEMYRKTLALDPNYLFAYYNLGVLYQEQKEWGKAIFFYKRALKLDPGYFNVYYNLGLVYKETGDYERAIDSYERAIALDSRHGHVYNNLGVVYWLKGDKHEAVRSFLQAVERGPDYFTGYYNLGNIYQIIGDYRKAIDAYRAALKIDPAHRGVREKLREIEGVASP